MYLYSIACADQATVFPWFYPGSGTTEGCNASLISDIRATTADPTQLSYNASASTSTTGLPNSGTLTVHSTPSDVSFHSSKETLLEPSITQPHIINVGLPARLGPKYWRRIMTADILPRIAAFSPSLILISAGFDAHHKDEINCGYLSLREEDYEWITQQLMKIAVSCNSKVVSVLEGGYKIQGRIVSAFGRSVAAHVRALTNTTQAAWNTKAELVCRYAHIWCCDVVVLWG